MMAILVMQKPFNDFAFKWFLGIMLRTYLFCLISASLNASSCCFCLLFIATEIIDDALIAPAPPGKEGYQKNKNYLKGFRFVLIFNPFITSIVYPPF